MISGTANSDKNVLQVLDDHLGQTLTEKNKTWNLCIYLKKNLTKIKDYFGFIVSVARYSETAPSRHDLAIRWGRHHERLPEAFQCIL
jgi:hypothetical protein